MKVILNHDVPNLGEEGDILEVSAGYARNFLLPGGKVLQHTVQNLALIEGRRATIDKRKAEKRQNADTLKNSLENEPLEVKMMAGENGRLFGSVTAATIVDELAKKGVIIEKKRIEIPDSSLKAVGNYKVRVRLYGEQEAFLNVRVESTQQEKEESAPVKKPVEVPVTQETEQEIEQETDDELTPDDEFEAKFDAETEDLED